MSGADRLDDLMRDKREMMVEQQILARGIDAAGLVDAMRRVPREEFVNSEYVSMAYDDKALPIEAGQTISQPCIVARMIELASIQPNDTVLEVGLGSGYAAAVLSCLAKQVFAIDRHRRLTEAAGKRLARLGYENVKTGTGDGTAGWAEMAPFDAIIVAAAAPRIPLPLQNQLTIGGRLVIPVGNENLQQLVVVTRTGEDEFEQHQFDEVHFVPLIGAQGWTAAPDTGLLFDDGGFR